MSNLSTVAMLREMLLHYERDLGLNGLTQIEKDILYTFRIILGDRDPREIIRSEDVKRHENLKDVAHATYHRAVKSLVEKGFLDHAQNRQFGDYRLARAEIQ